MRNFKLSVFIGLLVTFLIADKGRAQILSPVLECLNADTLVWSNVVNNCGPFIEYNIYSSINEGGPYSLLATITNEAQDLYILGVPPSEVTYFYIESNYDCPGEIVIPSDTISSAFPSPVDITYLSVNAQGFVEINWEDRFDSPKTTAYWIYRLIDGNVVKIGEAGADQTAFLDTGVDANSSIETYYVLGVDACDNTSIFTEPHSTVFMVLDFSYCGRYIDLAWNLYDSWEDRLVSQEVWMETPGSSPLLLTTLDDDSSEYRWEDVSQSGEYCFYVVSISIEGYQSISSYACIDADFETVLQFEKLIGMNTIGEDLVLTFDVNNESGLAEYTIKRERLQDGKIDNLGPFMDVASGPEVFVDSEVVSNSSPLYTYQVQLVDECSTVYDAIPLSNIYLEGILDGDNLSVSWQHAFPQEYEVQEFRLKQVVGNVESILGIFDAATFTAEVPLDPNLISSQILSFYIEAVINESWTNLGNEFLLNSNSLEPKAELNILFPNALSPQGINNQFKAVLIRGRIESFELKVFDRYGQEIFHSEDINQAWDGRINNQYVDVGVYTYRAYITTTDLQEKVYTGSFVVVL